VSPRLFLDIASLEARKLMSYRVDFWLTAIVAFATDIVVAYFVWLAVFQESGREQIGGYTHRGMVLYYVLAVLLGRLVRGQERQLALARDIYEGTLTRYLLYPTGTFPCKYAEHLGSLGPGLLQLLLLGAAALLVLELPAGLHVGWTQIAMGATSVLVANLLYFLILYPVQCIAFWADNVWTLNVMVRFVTGLLGGLLLPLSLFPDWSQRLLELLPFQYLFFVPVRTVLGEVTPDAWFRGLVIGLAWCVILAILGRLVWRRGTLRYTGVGI
jgi:ABC-2 type transport system permease protein